MATQTARLQCHLASKGVHHLLRWKRWRTSISFLHQRNEVSSGSRISSLEPDRASSEPELVFLPKESSLFLGLQRMNCIRKVNGKEIMRANLRPFPAAGLLIRSLSTIKTSEREEWDGSFAKDMPSIETNGNDVLTSNALLEAYIEAGKEKWVEMTTELKSRKGNQLSLLNEADNRQPTVGQLRLASHVQDILEEMLDELEDAGSTTLCIGPSSESLVIEAVEVSRDCKHARVHWTLPASVIGIWSHDRVIQATEYLQSKLDQNRKRIQHEVLMRITRAYVPRLRFVAMDTVLSHSKEAVLERRRLRKLIRDYERENENKEDQ